MNKELKELLNKINVKKAEVRAFAEEGKLEEARNAKEELKKLQDSFDILADLEDEVADNTRQQDEEGKATTVNGNASTRQIKAFTNVVNAYKKNESIAAEDKEVLNSMSEGIDEKGGLVVPKDITTEIKELRRSEDALETLVNVEHVTTKSGSRVIEAEAEHTPFDNVEEAAEFPEESTPEFRNIEYKIKKKGGILKTTNELLEDSAENIIAYLKRWITKKSKATRNFMIINKVKEICEGLEVNVAGFDDLKDIFNVMLDPAISEAAIVVTNQSGFNFLDKLKDDKGNYILQKDPTMATKRLLFGEHPVTKLSNKTLKNVNGKVPIICGNLKEAITIFDREMTTINISDVAGDMWGKDQTGIKVRERLDIQAVDKDAVVMGFVAVSTAENDINNDGVNDDINGDGKYNDKELEKLSVEEILELAKKKSLTLTKTKKDSKAEIIKDFLAKQG